MENTTFKLGSYVQSNPDQLNKSDPGSALPWADDLRTHFKRHPRDGGRTHAPQLI